MLNYRKSGFSLVEALLATLILSIGVVAIGQLVKLCNTNDSVGDRYEQAWLLLDSHLDELTIAENFDELAAKGKIEDDYESAPDYSYKIECKPAEHQDLYEIELVVTFQQGTNIYQAEQKIFMYIPIEEEPEEDEESSEENEQ